MRVEATPAFKRALRKAPPDIVEAFNRQLARLLENSRHPSLDAKRYRGTDYMQARVTRSWRFYFRVEGDVYVLIDVTPHP